MTQIITNNGGGGSGVGVYKYKGSVDYYTDLPSSGMKVGDTYNVVNAFTKDGKDYPAGTNVAWTGTEWDALGGSIDLSDYQKKLVEGAGIDIDGDTNEISVDTTVIATQQDLTTKQDVISDLGTIRSNASAGKSAKDAIDTYGDIVTHNVSEFATAAQGTKADTALQPNDNVSELVNDAGYLVSSDLKQSDWGQSDSSKIDYIKNKPTIGNATLTIQRNGTQVNTFTANATSNVTANISVPTKTSDITNDSGFIDKDVNNLTNYTLTTSLASVATSGSYNDLSNKPSIPTKTSDLANDSGFIDKDVNNLTNYTLSSDLATVATSGSYTDLSNKPTIGTASLTIQKNGTNVATFGANATSGVTANITVPTKVTDLSDGGDYVKSASLAAVATTGDYDDLTDKPTIPGVINTLTSTSATDALSAAQGKALNEKIDNLAGLGKFLSLWDSATGQPISFPLDTPYTYSTGDWFMVEVVGTTNYKPNGSSYTGAASTTVESGEVAMKDVYIYDGQDWLLQKNTEVTVSFGALAGQPTDNANLATALNAKQDVSNMVTTLTGADNTHYPTAKAVADALSGAGNGDMLKATYDPNNVEANAFDYNNFINTPSLATVATSGLYSDLSGTPTLATVATSGSYNDLSNKPTIPTVNNATLTIQKNGTTVKTFTANASSNVTANITVPTKTSDISNDSGYITKSVNDLTNYTLSSALATVATTGSYSDLSNKPTIPTDTSDLTNDAGFITGITSGDVTTALGYTPYNSTNPSGYVTSSIISDTAYGSGWDADTTHAPTKNAVYDKLSAMDTTISGKQNTLVSGTNIKTINNNSLLGSGNIEIESGATYTAGTGIAIGAEHSDMQGPAPDGFHVPLNTEWQAVIDAYTGLGLSGGDNFRIYLKMPFAGFRDYSNSDTDDIGGRYWSSSRYNTDSAYSLDFNIINLFPQLNDYCASGRSVRCFKNSPVTPDSSWTTLYQGSGNAGIFHNATDGLISISSDGTTWITIMDKNLGATTVYNDGDTLSEANCGKYYQWGNNYGFAWTGDVTTSSTQVDASGYGPGNYYESSTFITGSEDWSSVQNDNLWGGISQGTWIGEGSTITNTGVLSVNGQTGNVTTHSTTTCTLTSAGWSSNSQTVNVTGVTASNTVIVSPAPDDIADYADCGVYCSAQGSGTLTFGCDTAPSGDIVVNVLIMS